MDGGTKNILITGLPGTGKTTLAVKLAGKLTALRPSGFYTEEIREGGMRRGFALQSFDGRKGLLAHVDIKGPRRVGKYGVDLAGFEGFLDAAPLLAPETKLVIIDEIGKMECLSPRFRRLLGDVLDSAVPLIATIALKGAGFIADVKARPDVRIFVIGERNREELLDELLRFIEDQ